MTQTIRKPEGRNKLWIAADHGSKPSYTRYVVWYKITLEEYLRDAHFEDLDDDQAEQVKNELLCFNKTGTAWFAVDGYETCIFATAKEARDWAYSRNC